MNTDAKWRRHTFEKNQLADRIRRNVRPLLDDEAFRREAEQRMMEAAIYGRSHPDIVIGDGEAVFDFKLGNLNYDKRFQHQLDAYKYVEPYSEPARSHREGTYGRSPVQAIIDADFEVVEQRLLSYYSADVLKELVQKIAQENDHESLFPYIDRDAVEREAMKIMGLTKRPTYMASLRRRIASAFKFLLFGIGSGA